MCPKWQVSLRRHNNNIVKENYGWRNKSSDECRKRVVTVRTWRDVADCSKLERRRPEKLGRRTSTTAYRQSARRWLIKSSPAVVCHYFPPGLHLYLVSIHQLRRRTSNCRLLLIYWLRENKRLSWPGWLTSSGQFTYISHHPSAEGRACDRESSSAKDRSSTTVPRHQLR